MKKSEVVQLIFQHLAPARQNTLWQPQQEKGLAFAPTNIALCKYWGKRDNEINLPKTSSLSVALPDKGALTSITPINATRDEIILNGQAITPDQPLMIRTVQFLDLFRPQQDWHVRMESNMNLPIAAGLASSACGMAALVSALNDLFNWQLSMRHLSILARLGSGSAARSLWLGFVEWHAGAQADGMDSYAEPLPFEWPELRIGILSLSEKEKSISSRDAMQRTVNSSALYACWPKKVLQDMVILKQALQVKNFSLLGGTAESNALTMHATMLSSWPSVCYSLPETIAAMHEIWALRQQGLEIYFTQDAGPNLKILYLAADEERVLQTFPTMVVIKLFEG